MPKKNSLGTLTTYASREPKDWWIQDFFTHPDEFFGDNCLSPSQQSSFKRYLRDGGIIGTDGKLTTLGKIIAELDGYSGGNPQDCTAQAFIYANLVNNSAQFRWYASNISTVPQSTECIARLLTDEGEPRKAAKSIVTSFAKFAESMLGKSDFAGIIPDYTNGWDGVFRKELQFDNSEVILYAIYQYAERIKQATGFKPEQFQAERLLDTENPETRDFIPVGAVLGIGKWNARDFKRRLRGLSTIYGNCVNNENNLFHFWDTNGLNAADVNPNKSPEDVIIAWRKRLIREGRITTET